MWLHTTKSLRQLKLRSRYVINPLLEIPWPLTLFPAVHQSYHLPSLLLLLYEWRESCLLIGPISLHKSFYTQLSINGVIVYFCYFMSHWAIAQAIVLIITQPSIHGVIVYFLLCHESLKYWPGNIFDYWLALYHGLVSRFPVKNTKALISMRDDNARAVHLWKETSCNNGENEAWFGNFEVQ